MRKFIGWLRGPSRDANPWPRCDACFHRTDPHGICAHYTHPGWCCWCCEWGGAHPPDDEAELDLNEEWAAG